MTVTVNNQASILLSLRLWEYHVKWVKIILMVRGTDRVLSSNVLQIKHIPSQEAGKRLVIIRASTMLASLKILLDLQGSFPRLQKQ